MTTGAKLISLLLLVLVSACSNRTFSVSIEQMETETPSSQSYSLPATWTPSPTLPPRATTTPFPTFTAVPPLTLVPLLPTATDVMTELGKRSNNALISPNGQWSVNVEPSGMQIANQTTGKVWTLPCTLFKECGNLIPVEWSSDSSSLYFGLEASIAEAPIGIHLYQAVARIDMETGAWEKVLEESDRYYDFAVSNDNAYIAYTQPKGNFSDNHSVILSVQNIKNGRQAKYTLDGFAGGNIVWSPFTTRFVFQIQDPAKGTSLLYYDVDLDVLKYILKDEKSNVLISSWGEDNLVSLQKTGWSDRTITDWTLNPFTNEMTPLSASN